MNAIMEVPEVVAVSTHSRFKPADPMANKKVTKDRQVAVVRTDDGKWLAVVGAHCDAAARPIDVIQHMKSSDVRRHGMVWALWDGVKGGGFWDTVPDAMPLYEAK